MEENKKANDAKPETKESATPKYNPLMPIVAVAVVLALAAAVFFGSKLLAGDEGINIPGDFKEYEADDFSVGYPEDWSKIGEGSYLFISSEGIDSESEEGAGVVIFGSDVNEDDEDAEKNRSAIKSGDCGEIEDVEDSFGDDEFELKETKSVKLNGAKACKFTMSNNDDSEGTMYLIISSDDKKAYAVYATYMGKDNKDNYDEAVKVVKTFKLKD